MQPQPVHRGGGEAAATQIARYETASAITGILTEAAALQEFSVTADDLDADPWLFNCQNGTLDLRTMELRPARPGRPDLQDRQRRLPSRHQRHRSGRRSSGKCCPTTRFAAICNGSPGCRYSEKSTATSRLRRSRTVAGANGKTTFIEAVCFAMGDYAMTAEPTLLMSKRGEAHPTGVADLLGKRLVTTTETEQGAPVRHRAAEAAHAAATPSRPAGCGRISSSSRRATCCMMCTNHLPEIDDGTEAVWRRIRLIPFTVEIPERRTRREPQGQAARRGRRGVELDHRRLGRLPQERASRTRLRSWPPPTTTRPSPTRSDGSSPTNASPAVLQSSATTKRCYAGVGEVGSKERLPADEHDAFGRALDAKGFPIDQRAHGRRRRRRICLKPPNSAGFFKGAGP